MTWTKFTVHIGARDAGSFLRFPCWPLVSWSTSPCVLENHSGHHLPASVVAPAVSLAASPTVPQRSCYLQLSIGNASVHC